MKNLCSLVLLLVVFLAPNTLNAQDKDVKRPKNIGASDFDSFKNSSFDVKDESVSLKKNVTHLDNEIKKYSGIINTIAVAKLKADYKALKESKEALTALNKEIKALDEKGKTMVENAKKLKPKTKSLGAVKNSNSSMKGLNLAKTDLKDVSELLANDMKIVSAELKSRGEPIE